VSDARGGRCARLFLLVAALMVGTGGYARAQILAGQAVEQSTGLPLTGLLVQLRHVMSDSTSRVVDTVRTDARGLFQFVAPGRGAYYLTFGSGWAGLADGPVDTVTMETVLQRRYDVPVLALAAAAPFTSMEVDRQVALRPGNPAPRYPAALRHQGEEGEVEVSFVVDTAGRVEAGSAFVTRTTHTGFVEVTMELIPRLRFSPAEIAGIRVRQRAAMPFIFSMEGGARFPSVPPPLPPAPRMPEPAMRRP
jgi:TonB family protein